MDGTWSFERKISSDENEYEVRSAQVEQRVRECEKAFELLRCLSSGQIPGDHLLHKQEEFIHSLSHLDLQNCFVSGHSFGGATALKALYTSRLGFI